jgi:O-antigen/teichoic acid export membrane protein
MAAFIFLKPYKNSCLEKLILDDSALQSEPPASRNAKSRIYRALSFSLVAEVFGKLAPFICLRIALNSMGLEAFGKAQYLLWVIELLGFWINAGYGTYGVIAAAENLREGGDLGRTYAAITANKLLLLGLAASLFLLYGFNSKEFHAYGYDIVLLSMFLLAVVVDAYYFAVASKLLARVAKVQMMAKILQVAAVYLLIAGPSDYVIFAAVILATNALVALFTAGWLIRQNGFSWCSWQEFRSCFRRALPFSIGIILLVSLERFDLYFIERYFAASALGAYSAASRLIIAASPLIWVIGHVFFGEALHSDEQMAQHRLRQGMTISGGVVILGALVTYFYSEMVLQTIYGRVILQAAQSLQILIWGLVAQLVYHTFGSQWLTMKKKLTQLNLALAISLGVGLVFAYRGAHIAEMDQVALGALLGRVFFAMSCIALAGPWAMIVTFETALRLALPAALFIGCSKLLTAQSPPFASLIIATALFMLSWLLIHRRQIQSFAQSVAK